MSNRSQTSEAETRFRRLVEGVDREFVFYAYDLNGVVTYLSPAIEAVLGYTPEQLIGRNWRIVAGDDANLLAVEQHEEQAISGRQPKPEVYEVVAANGEHRLLEVLSHPVFDEDGGVVGVEGVCKDVTEAKRQEKQLRDATTKLDGRVRDRTAELEYRLQFEQLLVALSTQFIHAPVEEMDKSLEAALAEIGGFTGADRCFLYQFSEDLSTRTLTHEWVAAGGKRVKQKMRGASNAQYAWGLRQLQGRKPIYIRDTHQLPSEAAALRSLYDQLGIRSTLNVPLHHGDRLIGMMGLANLHEPRQWKPDEVALVQVLAGVLVNALDRRDYELRLRASEKHLRTIVEDQSDLIVRWLPDGTITFVNRAVCELREQPADELLGDSVFVRIHPEDLPSVKDKIARLTPEQPTATAEYRVLAADGSTRWIQWVDRALYDDSGELQEYQSVGHDVTKLKQAESELQSRLNFERLVLSLSLRFINMPIERIGRELTEALKHVSEFTGAERSYVFLADEQGEMAHMRYFWSMPDAPPLQPEAKRVVIKDHPWAIEKLSRGEPIHVPQLSAMPAEAETFRDLLESVGVKSYVNVPLRSGKHLIGYLGFATFSAERTWSREDIALLRVVGEVFVNALQRQDAEQALATSEERLRTTIESVDEGLYDWRIDTGEIYVSDHMLRTIGLPPGENQRHFRDWFNRVHPDDKPLVDEALEKHFRGETPMYEVETRIQDPTGEYRWFHGRGRVVERDAAGKPLRMVGVDRDISEQIAQREKTQQLETQLAHLGRVATMGETVAGIAHEVNQPLHAAATFNAAARRALESNKQDALDRVDELCHKVGDQVARAGDIIRRLRNFTRPQRGKLRPVKLNELAEEVVQFTSNLSVDRAVRFQFELDPRDPIVEGDAVQLQQVLVNLVQNACDSLRDSSVVEPTVTIGTQVARPADASSGGSVQLWVADNGPTLEAGAKQFEELFEPFYTTKANGMGIGLSLCRTIAEAHRGSIDAEANDCGGMKFTLRLPAAKNSLTTKSR